MSHPDPASTSVATPSTVPARPPFRARWAELLDHRHPPHRWAVIAAAIRTADSARVDAFGDPLLRGSEDWCRLAITALEAPAADAAASERPQRLPDRCLHDDELLRAWLSAPAPYADPSSITVADLVADRDWSQAGDETTHQGLQRLLAAAQDAGVWGVHGYRIELHGLTGEDGSISRYLVVARPVVGPGLASAPLDHLVPATPKSGVDSSMAVLATAAREVDTILDRLDTFLRAAAAGAPDRAPRAAFPPPTEHHPAPPTRDTPAPADTKRSRGSSRGR